MRYLEFRKKVSKYPFFSKWIYGLITDNVKTLQDRIVEWVSKGYVIKLKKDLYTLNDEDRAVRFSNFYLANHLYQPSYVSLEAALSFYEMIPEGVYEVTSVTSKKTQRFTNALGRFSYAHIKQDIFTAYISLQDRDGKSFYIASKEKALLDFFYLRLRHIQTFKKDIFEESYRLQNLEDIDCEKLLELSKLYKQKKLSAIIEMFIEYIREEWQ